MSPQQKDKITRDLVDNQLREMGSREFTQVYIPQSVRASMSDVERQRLQSLEELSRYLRTRRESRAEKAKFDQASVSTW